MPDLTHGGAYDCLKSSCSNDVNSAPAGVLASEQMLGGIQICVIGGQVIKFLSLVHFNAKDMSPSEALARL